MVSGLVPLKGMLDMHEEVVGQSTVSVHGFPHSAKCSRTTTGAATVPPSAECQRRMCRTAVPGGVAIFDEGQFATVHGQVWGK